MPIHTYFEQNGDSSALVVLLHGWSDDEEEYADLVEAVKMLEPNADLLRLHYRKGIAHNENPFVVASEVEVAISETYEQSLMDGKPYQRIVLIGYSLGALLIRKAYVYGRGSEEDRPNYPHNTPPNDWTTRVERIILLAGINRGWSLDNQPANMSLIRFIAWRYVLAPIVRALPILKVLKEIERGAPFVVNLRIQWIRLIQREPNQMVPVFQLLGTVDSLVSSSDDRDLYVHREFIYIPVEGADHQSLIRFDNKKNKELGQRCWKKFTEALGAPIQKLQEEYEGEQHVTQELLETKEKHIIFVLHGIRDYGGWTGDLREDIGRVATQLQLPIPKVVTAKYDFFSMGKFLLSRFLPRRSRHKYVRWFMDQYTEQIATFPNPNSKVSFIGHSNGTYILASALKQYQTLQIHRASFAGSVVPREYPWEQYIREEGRVETLRNDRAASDWVVGLFPKIFDQLNFSDVGSGGFDGFNDDAANQLEGPYYIGGHSAAIQPANYESLSKFVLTGQVERDERLTTRTQPGWLVILSRASILVWILVFLLVFGPPIYFVLHAYYAAALAYILFVLFVTSYI